MTSRLWTGGVVTLACALAASSAAATPVAIDSMAVDVTFTSGHRALLGQMGDNCVTLTSDGWRDLSTRHRAEYSQGYGARGTFDGVTNGGQVRQVGPALKLEGTVLGPIKHPYIKFVSIADVGIEAAGGRVYVTARLRSGKEQLAATSRARIALIARPKFFAGPAKVPRRRTKTIPDTFLMAVQGQATVMPALSAAVKRLRCSRKTNKFVHPHAVRPGTKLGLVTAQLRPQAATGTDGTVDLVDGPNFSAEEGDIQVQPVAPAKRVTANEAPSLRLPFASGNRVALSCRGGSLCEATGGTVSLAGAFTAAANGRTATIDALKVFYAEQTMSHFPGLMGSVNGRPVTLVQPGERLVTDEARAALSDALGVQVVTGEIGDIDDTFTLTEPI